MYEKTLCLCAFFLSMLEADVRSCWCYLRGLGIELLGMMIFGEHGPKPRSPRAEPEPSTCRDERTCRPGRILSMASGAVNGGPQRMLRLDHGSGWSLESRSNRTLG